MQSKSTTAAYNALHSVLTLCIEISERTKADCFFDYSPHVNSYCVHIYRNGWETGVDAEYVDLQSDITTDNIKATLDKLAKILFGLEERENV